MNLLILLRNKSENINQQKDYYYNLFKSIKVTIIDDYDVALRLSKVEKYKLLLVMTDGQEFPETWDMKVLQSHSKCPTMIITYANELCEVSVLTFIESLQDTNVYVNSNNIIKRSIEYIEENLYNEELSLEKVAAHVYVSKCHYSRLFQKHMGKGFKAYVIDKRINKAKMLLNKGEPVTAVCYLVGYNDLTHFGRIFKRLVGVNPSKYKEKTYSKIS
ncbi:helix-turn-helix transcriptional regulator [Bacillus infantis]|uniref:Helix-turn-helix transcriptional regulator n=1 Tax=Bacillus infantis TaxID=324767 RepID=A0A5D4SAA7_9BACI|nr:AraC family transcriptional regulator [Bacillus infantis]TYS60575.1 helix-turn-helix transcriptional regulator [Bacillus infantis]